jgi:hypothetical protein
MGKSTINVVFSIAVLNYQRVMLDKPVQFNDMNDEPHKVRTRGCLVCHSHVPPSTVNHVGLLVRYVPNVLVNNFTLCVCCSLPQIISICFVRQSWITYPCCLMVIKPFSFG